MPASLGLAHGQVLLGLAALTLAGCSSKPLTQGSDAGSAGNTAMGGEPGAVAAAGGASQGAIAGGGEATRLLVLDRAEITSEQGADNFQRATASVDFGIESVSRAALRVTLESPCFPFDKWADPAVPAGQRWPAACDAFDRTLYVALDEPADGATTPLPFELLRAITPFGGPLEVEADITDIVNGLPGRHTLTVFIDTFSDADGLVSGSQGEWLASAEVSLWAGAAPRHVLSALPLVFETQTEPDAARVSFDAPEGAASARIEYRVTGHGQAFSADCLGPAEEFCARTHELSLDDARLNDVLPWRDDCAELCTLTQNDSGHGPTSYCAENPCGDPNSVRAPRANWCPGSGTPPIMIDAAALTAAGTHEFSRRIPALAAGGIWRVSAAYFAFE